MNTLAKNAIAISVGALVAGAAFVWSEGTLTATIDRFPDIDRKIARKAYWKVMRNVSAGRYGDVSSFDTDKMDKLFLHEVALLTNK